MTAGQKKQIDRETSWSPMSLLVALAWLWLVTVLPFVTDAACNMFIGFALAVSWMLLALVWLCVPLFAYPSLRSPRRRSYWLSAGLAGLLGLLLAFNNVGLQLRVALSERWLVEYVATVPPGTRESLHPFRRVGLFWVDGTEEKDGVVLLYTSTSFLNRYGVAHVPDGATPPTHLRNVRHLFGPWYSFEWKF